MATWRLVPRPHRRKIIKSKWVFKVKRRPDHSVHKLKARLVATGYTQIRGLDYDEVFSPTLRLVLSLMASKDWKGRQVDFKTAFLNGHLDHNVYMEQPPGFEDSLHPDWVCQLDRSIYGLKQSPRQWNAELHQALLDLGLSVSKYNPTLYFKIEEDRIIGALTTHVNDLAIVGESTFVDHLITSLGKKFQIGDDQDLHHFLSLRITRDRANRHVFLNQSHYIEDLCTPFLDVHTPRYSFRGQSPVPTSARPFRSPLSSRTAGSPLPRLNEAPEALSWRQTHSLRLLRLRLGGGPRQPQIHLRLLVPHRRRRNLVEIAQASHRIALQYRGGIQITFRLVQGGPVAPTPSHRAEAATRHRYPAPCRQRGG